jgi:recombination protein RecT
MNELTVIKESISSLQKSWVSQSGLSGDTFQKEASFAVQHMTKNPFLLTCTKESILKAVMNIAQTGLTLNPVQKYAYLVPRRNGNNMECCLDPSYMGLVKLLTDTGSVKNIQSQVIHQGDQIDVDLASDEKVLKHVPYFLSGADKGTITGVYSKAVLHDGTIHCEIMSYKDILDIRERSESYKAYKNGKVKTCIWISDESEMCRKTVIKRHWKYLPKSDQTEKFERAIELDNYANGFDSPVEFSIISLLEEKINSAQTSEEKKDWYIGQLHEIETQGQALKMLTELSEIQPTPGRDRTPQGLSEQSEAVNYSIQKENLYAK